MLCILVLAGREYCIGAQCDLNRLISLVDDAQLSIHSFWNLYCTDMVTHCQSWKLIIILLGNIILVFHRLVLHFLWCPLHSMSSCTSEICMTKCCYFIAEKWYANAFLLPQNWPPVLVRLNLWSWSYSWTLDWSSSWLLLSAR